MDGASVAGYGRSDRDARYREVRESMRRTRAASFAAVTAAATLLLAACGGGGGSTGGQGGGGGEASGSSTATGIFKGCTDPLTCNAASPDQLQQGGQVSFAIE